MSQALRAVQPEETATVEPIAPATAPAAVPENWYILATSREVPRGAIVTRWIGEREIVMLRTAGGRIAAFDAHCAHMGCHLRHGTVVGETLRCALHFRTIDPSGRFLRPDGTASADLVQGRHPVEERHGAIWVYAGRGAPPPLPVPDVMAEGDLLARPAGEYRNAAPWHSLIANGCDMEHLLAVHERVLKEPPVITRPDPRTFRVAYRTAVAGRTLGDRIMRQMSGNDIRASMTVIGGSLLMVQSLAGPVPTLFLFSMCPQPDGGTLVHGIVGVNGRTSRLKDRLRLVATRWLFMSFLRKDFRVLEGLEWHPPAQALTAGDRATLDLFAYFRSLAPAPRAAKGAASGG